MKQNHSSKRHRGRSNGRRGSHGPGHSIESNGPDVKIRGKASQLYEKYQSLSHDALSSGDRVASESYLQHAEHYYRVMASQAPQSSENSKDGRGKAGPERDEKTAAAPEAQEAANNGSADASASRGDEVGEGDSASA